MNNTNKRQRLGMRLVVLIGLFLALLPLAVAADEMSELNFYVRPQLPDSQIENGASGYFDLNIAPGESDRLGLELTNNSEQDITVRLSAHTAYTNVNGVVEYGKEAEEADPTLPASLNELIEVPEDLVLAANESQTVMLPITMPEEAFEGVLAGGIRLEEVLDEETQEQEGEGLAIRNAFSYVVGVVVSNNRSATDPGLDLLDVFADQLNYRNVISAQIQNYTPTFVNRLEVEAAVRAQGQDEVLYEAHQEGMQMAPNSHFNFPISLEGDRFRSGNYVLSLTARSQEEEWTWEHPFTIEADQARRLNQEDVTIDSGINWWVISLILALVLLLGVLGYLIYKQKKQQASLEQETNPEDK